MNSKRIYFVLVITLLLALALAACGKDKQNAAAPTVAPTAIPAPAQAAQEAPAQEAPATESPLVAAGASPLATPNANSPLPTPGPELTGLKGQTTAETGAIVGRIVVNRDGVDIPVGEMIVGLADVIRDDKGVIKASGYTSDTPNKGTTGDDGSFAINNVPVGLYSLILDAIITSYQLENPETGETIIADVKAGETLDIGVLRYHSLPVPGFDAK